MKSSEQVERIVGQARLKADQATDTRILRDAGAAFVESAPPARRSRLILWRFIMESKVTRYSAAAVVALAAALVLLSPFGTSRNGSVVLADVADKVNEMGNSVLTGHRTVWCQGQEEPCLKADAAAYVSSEHGYMEE